MRYGGVEGWRGGVDDTQRGGGEVVVDQPSLRMPRMNHVGTKPRIKTSHHHLQVFYFSILK